MHNLHQNFISVYGINIRRLILPFFVWSQRLTFDASYHRKNSPKKWKRLHNSSPGTNDNYWKAKRHIILIILSSIHYKREPYWKYLIGGQSKLTQHSWNPKCLPAKSPTPIQWQFAIIRRFVCCGWWVPVNNDWQTSQSWFPVAMLKSFECTELTAFRIKY